MVKVLNKDIGVSGYGMMGLTWRTKPITTEQAIEALKAALNNGLTFWNAGEFYGSPDYNSLQLLNAYFTKYPEDADKVVVSIKGGMDPATMHPTGDEAGVRRSIDQCLKVLDGKKFIDIFECARVDPKVPIEKTIGYIASYVSEGKIGGIGLSEVGVESIRKAAKVHPIAVVEQELSLFSNEILENGITTVCAELDIPIVAYSPLGRGFLTGELKSASDIPDGDFRKTIPRFQPENFDKNLELVREVEKVAQAKSATTSQVALQWVRSYSGKPGMPPIIPIAGSATAKRVEENAKVVDLNETELSSLNDAVKRCGVAGGRYGGDLAKLNYA